jgi:hypothetical protein
MHHSKNDDRFHIYSVNDFVWTSAGERHPGSAVNDWIGFGIPGDRRQARIDCSNELGPQALCALFIPLASGGDVRCGPAPNLHNERISHRVARMLAFTFSQGS